MLASVFVVLICVVVDVLVTCVVAVFGCVVTVLGRCLAVVVASCVVSVLEAVIVIGCCVVFNIHRDSVGFCSVAVVVVMKGPAVVYDAASPVYDDVFFAVNSKKNEKSITSHRNVSLCR